MANKLKNTLSDLKSIATIIGITVLFIGVCLLCYKLTERGVFQPSRDDIW